MFIFKAIFKCFSDWVNYINALKEIGYDGYFTIEREAGEKPFDDIKSAFEFINKLI